MGNSRNTGFLQNAVKVADNGDISLMHGSTMLMQISASGAITTTGVISGSAAANATSASYAASSTSASYAASATSASYAVSATTASYADALTVAGTLTAQTLVVQTITSSVDFVTGSTRFGSILGNTHVFSGSVTMNPNGLFVSSSGLVGIGTTNPSFTLDVNGSGRFASPSTFGTSASNGDVTIISNSGPFTIRGRATYDRAFLGLSWDTSPDRGVMIANELSFNTGAVFGTNVGTEKMRITSAGNIGFSTSSPGDTLPTVSPNQGWTFSSRKVLEIASTDTNGNAGVFMRRSDLLTGLDVWSDNYFGDSYIDNRWDNSAGAINFRMRTAGTPVQVLRLTPSGVKFQNGSSSLNYYEEGTFTPSNLNSNMSAVTPIFGRYVRIGSQVTINVRWSVSPGGTGQKYLVFNLPFAFNGASGVSYTGAVSNYNSGLSSYSSNVGTSVRNSSGSDTQQYVEAVFTTNTDTVILFSMTYFTF